jgi:ribosomal protein L3 glutamine methyltransferase
LPHILYIIARHLFSSWDYLLSGKLKTIADFIRFAYSRMNGSDIYFGHGTDNAWDESVALVLQSLRLPWDFSQELWSCRVTEDEREMLYSRVDKRINERVPVPYLTHEAWFCELPFYVDERVLVPRSPLAELIQAKFFPWISGEPARILDLCCGSGCIGIASAVSFPDAEVVLSDLSQDALDVALMNIAKHGLEERVSALKSDCFAALSSADEGSFDLIVSNPPYVDAADVESMPSEYRHEPMLGLASGEDGLDLTRLILKDAAKYLKPNGILIVEVGNSWVALEEAYPDVAFMWLEFEHGGHGVFMLTADQLKDLNK